MMGLKHLEQITEFFKKNIGVFFTKSQIRDELRIDYHTVLDVLAYLLKEKKIVMKDKKYAWRK